MMGTNFTSSAWMWGFHLHWIFGTALAVGVVLMVIWAAKTLKPAELKTWVIWLLVVGIIGTLLTSGMGWRGWGNMMNGMHNWNKNIDWKSMTDHMKSEDHSELSTPEEWQEHMKEEMKEHMGWGK